MREVDILSYLPDFYRDFRESQKIAEIQEKFLKEAIVEAQEVFKELFILLAQNFGLEKFEKMLGISTYLGKSVEERRFEILAKLNGLSNYSFEKVFLLLVSLCGKENVEMKYNEKEFHLIIKLKLRAKEKEEIARRVLYEILPCNIFIEIEIEFNSHFVLEEFKHIELEKYTYLELREKVLKEWLKKMKKSENIKLNLPEKNDYYNVEDFNENFRLLDKEVDKKQDKLFYTVASSNTKDIYNFHKVDLILGESGEESFEDLSNFLSDIPSGSRVMFLPGEYVFEESILIRKKVFLEGLSHNVIFKMCNDFPIFYIANGESGVDNVSIENIYFKKENWYIEPIIYAKNVNGLYINKCCFNAQNVEFKGKILSYIKLSGYASNVVISQCTQNNNYISSLFNGSQRAGYFCDIFEVKENCSIKIDNCLGIIYLYKKADFSGEIAFSGCTGERVYNENGLDGEYKNFYINCSNLEEKQSILQRQINVLAELLASGASVVVTASCGDVKGILYDNGTAIFSGSGVLGFNEEFFTKPTQKMVKVFIAEGVTEIDNTCFAGQSKISEVILPQSLKKIGSNAFSGCSGLVKINFPSGLEELGSGCFTSCGITGKIYLSNFKALTNGIFSGCGKISEVVIENVETLGSILSGCSGLKKMSLKNISNITSNAFAGNYLNELYLENILNISDGAFQYGSQISKVEMKNLVDIPSLCFAGTKLESINLTKENFSGNVGTRAFYNSPLKNIVIDKKDAQVGVLSTSCENIENAYFKIKEFSFSENETLFSNVKVIDKLYISSKNVPMLISSPMTINQLILEEGIEIIRKFAFYYVQGVSKIVLPKSVKEIGANAFCSMSELEEVEIFGNVTSIGSNAFAGSKNLKKVIIHKEEGAFDTSNWGLEEGAEVVWKE